MFQSMIQPPQPVIQAALLQKSDVTVVQGDYIQTESLTRSSSRTQWTQLDEWIEFSSDFRIFLDNIASEEKYALVFTVEGPRFIKT